MALISLLDAFRQVAPVSHSGGNKAAVRNAAAMRLATEIRSIARFLRSSTNLLDDAVQETLLKLVQYGPRGRRAGDPSEESGIRAFLFVSLAHALATLCYREGRARVVPVAWSENDSCLAGDGVCEWQRRAREEIAAARDQLFHEIVPEVAGRMGEAAAHTFLESVAEMREMQERGTDFSGVVARHAGALDRMADPATNRRVRNRVYTRHKDANKRLRQAIEALVRTGRVSDQRRAALEIVIDGFRRPAGREPAAANHDVSVG